MSDNKSHIRNEVIMMRKIIAIIILGLLLGACGTVEKRETGYWGRYSAGNTP
jgi:uncharacterized protein YceK